MILAQRLITFSRNSDKCNSIVESDRVIKELKKLIKTVFNSQAYKI